MSESMARLHEQLLDITEKVLTVCRENDIDCYLAYGSCLGAVRHGNVIPWDDDVDLYIRYQDYEKFKKAFCGDPVYFFQDVDTDPESIIPWAKIRKNHTTSMDVKAKALNMHWGICIDVFLLLEYDKPQIDRAAMRKLKELSILARLPYQQKVRGGIKGLAGGLILKLLGWEGRKKLLFRLAASLEKPGDYLIDISDANPSPVFRKEVFGAGTEMPFGSLQAKVPEDYDTYLRAIYGENYMEIPPEDSPLRYYHSNSVVDCDRDYREYQKAEN